ncbi:MAG TPA: cytochrome c [Pyrinomonadaceae bacterium]|nr:cytochrome c [Pyrinomonadaceae bacterium]
MLKCKPQEAVGTRQTAGNRRSVWEYVSRSSCLLLSAACLLFGAGCRVDMQDQPKMKPYRSSPFFKDGLSSRQLVPGTVPRGWLREDKELFTGKKSGLPAAPGVAGANQTAGATTTPVSGATASQVAAAYPDDVEKFPFPITKEILERGEGRYQIFCAVCHGPTGSGDGLIVRRGFRKPPSFYDPSLRSAPVGHFFDVVTNGWGAMPSYAAQIPVQDRWAIISYVRALQLTRPDHPSGAAPPGTPAAPALTATPMRTTPAKPTPGGQK